ncbi:MAG: ATP cone domain-containing protein [Pyrinomonadaceae bacterium]
MRCPFCGTSWKIKSSIRAKPKTAIRFGGGASVSNAAGVLRLTSGLTKFRIWSLKKTAGARTFDRSKIMAGLLRACEKRPISAVQLEAIVDSVEKHVQESSDREVADQRTRQTDYDAVSKRSIKSLTFVSRRFI